MYYKDEQSQAEYWLIGRSSPTKKMKREIAGEVISLRAAITWASILAVVSIGLLLAGIIAWDVDIACCALIPFAVGMFSLVILTLDTPLQRYFKRKNIARQSDFFEKHRSQIILLDGFVANELRQRIYANYSVSDLQEDAEMCRLIDEYFSSMYTHAIDKLIADEQAAGVVGSHELRKDVAVRAQGSARAIRKLAEFKKLSKHEQAKIIAAKTRAEKEIRDAGQKAAFAYRAEQLRSWV